MKKDAKAELLAKSWTVVATNYDKQLAPLFQPWIDQLLALFTAQRIPPGPIVAPACGPGNGFWPMITPNLIIQDTWTIYGLSSWPHSHACRG